jgi:hypothetical protein
VKDDGETVLYLFDNEQIGPLGFGKWVTFLWLPFLEVLGRLLEVIRLACQDYREECHAKVLLMALYHCHYQD